MTATHLPDGAGPLDIDAVTAAHQAWYRTFEQAILGIDAAKLEALALDDDARCVLGRWLDSPAGAPYAVLPEYGPILAAHRLFHEQARHIVDLLMQGEVDAAEASLTTAFRQSSELLTGLLDELRQRMQRPSTAAAPETGPAGITPT